jgi:membrane-associated phospholipid phosphatase
MSLSSLQRAEGAGEESAEQIGRIYLVPAVIGAFALLTMFVVALVYGLPIRDPDARYVGSPIALIMLIASVALLLDVLPRGFKRSRADGVGFLTGCGRVMKQRWLGRRGAVVLLCLVSFYATYLSYRNMKSFIPFITDANFDIDLLNFERWLFFGNDPAVLLHDILGVDFSAQVLSGVYLIFLTFVPVSLAVALIWSNKLQTGVWYVTALSINWVLGTVSYYLLPALGPIYERPGMFAQLPETGVTGLQEKLLAHRGEVLRDPSGTDAVSSIAAFASLHTSVVFTAAMVATLAGAPRLLRLGLWVYLGLTMISTVYFGWHYVVDDVAGLGIGFVAVFASARLTGFEWNIVPRLRALAQGSANAT